MSERIQTFLSKAAYLIYGALFSVVFLVSLFRNISYEYSTVTQTALMAAVIGLLAVMLKIYTPLQQSFYTHRYKILAVVCLMVFAVQFTVSSQLVPTVMYDYEKVFNGAVIWVTQGNSEDFQLYNNYLHHTPHQMGVFMILQFVFRLAASVGITDFFTVACFVGHLMFTVMLVTSFLYLDENISGHRALFFLGIIVLFLPLYFQSSVAYTDTYSIWCIPCLMLFATRAFKGRKLPEKIGYGALAGGVLALSIRIKSTAAIIMVALLIQRIVNGYAKKNFSALAALLVFFIAVNTAIDSWNYSSVLEESRKGESMPLTHWIMMGLQGDGSYSSYDEWSITCAVPADQRVSRNIEVIRQRLSELGPVGYAKLLYRKTSRNFGCGNAELYYTYLYSNDSQPINTVYEIILQNGRYYPVFDNLSQAVHLTSMLLGVAGAFIIVKKKTKDLPMFVPHIALIGFWIFMMLWESNHRQLINQWSLFFITAAIGLYHIWQLVQKKSE